MSYNHSYGDHKDCETDRECDSCKQKHPRPQKILLECGEGTGSRTFTTTNDEPFQLAHVTLDTTCLNRSKVLIKFSSLIKMERFDSLAGTVRLQYELFRVCGNRMPILLGEWMFEEVNVIDDDFQCQEEPFSFILCECTNCPSCCEYFVIVTPVEITNATAIVSNGRMAVLSGSVCDSSMDEYKTYDSKYDDTKLKPKHPRPKEVLLACGQGNGSIIFREEPELESPAGIAHVTVDTTCLSKPKVLIEFSSIIKIDRDVNAVRLQFQLFRVCGDGEPLFRGIWTFERTGVGEEVDLEKAFSFIFCECKVPSSCCEYFVMVTPIEIVTGNRSADVVVDNARMVAFAQSSQGCTYYHDCKTLHGKGECTYCVPRHHKPKKILLECGSGNGSRTFASSDDSAFQLAHVTIDTTCLGNPMVNIEFSSIVSFEGPGVPTGDGRLRYELFKVCGNRKPISLGIWVLDRIRPETFPKATNIFDFTFCDCITCSGCCDYFVTVTPIRIDNVSVTVRNGRMAALAGEMKEND